MKIRLKYYPQHENFSCGPVSLRMIFEHLGINYSEEKMIKLCHAMPKIGTSHKHLIDEIVSEDLKFIAKSNAQISDIIDSLEDGYPVLINYFNPLSHHGHYSVVSGYNKSKKSLFLADPANGNDYTIHWQEFIKNWHNEDNSSSCWMLIVGQEKITIDFENI